MVELEYVDALSYETVRRVLKKNRLTPWLRKQWVIPPKANGEFVWRMEDVLEVYTRPYDPRFPQVCLDETSIQLLTHRRPPLPLKPGQPECQDYEYGREGVANLLCAMNPWPGGGT